METSFTTALNNVLLMLPIMLLSLSVHEAAHAYAAFYYGDPTAYKLGRITLNPVAHIDLIGTIIIPILGIFTMGFALIGWAKPVPVNVHNLRNMQKAFCMVALAGPVSNIVLSVLFLLALVLFTVLTHLTGANLGSADGFIVNFLHNGILLNISLAVFNMIPIPPLDGSKVISYFLPAHTADRYLGIERYGFLIILVLINIPLFGAAISSIIFAIYEPYAQLASLIIRSVL